MLKYKPDNKKDGFEGYTHENVLADYEAGEGHLILHVTLACDALVGASTITVWSDNMRTDQAVGVFLHVCRR